MVHASKSIRVVPKSSGRMGQMILPDTNIFILGLSRSNSTISQLLAKWIENNEVVLSTIVIAEYLSKCEDQEAKRFSELFDYCQIIDVNLAVAKTAGAFRKKYLGGRKTIPLAAQCKISQTSLATLNPHDFPIPEISVFQPK